MLEVRIVTGWEGKDMAEKRNEGPHRVQEILFLDWLVLTWAFSITTLFSLGWIIPCRGGCPSYWKVLASIRGLYPLGDSNMCSPSYDNEKCLQTSPNVP